MRSNATKRAQALATFAALGLLSSGLGVTTPARATFPGANGKIAFDSTRADGNGDIWVMNPDGTGQVRLTTDPVTDDFASWSPGGNRIAFTSIRGGNSDPPHHPPGQRQ
jgi:dipeptidyl aminopeptidase/acylaminoacyl peptidase